MWPEDILELLRTHRFEPFRVWLSDGASYEIMDPDMAIVQKSRIMFGVPGRRGPDSPAARTINCALMHITRTEPLDGSDRRCSK